MTRRVFNPEALREARAKRGISGRKLATTIGLSTSMVSHMENGRTTPTVATLAALATALEVPMDDLVSAA